MTGKVGESYTTSAVTVDGYTLKETPLNASGKYTASDITVIYVYSKVKDVEPIEATLKVGGSTATLTKNVGSTIKLDAVASGGSGSYTYKFAVLNVENGKWTSLQNYSSNSSYTFALNYAGTKQFAVTVKDSNGETVATNRITVKVTNPATALKGTLTVGGSAASLTKTVGSTVKLDATASGGSGSYTYKFAVLNVDSGKWTALQNFSSNASYTFALNYTGTKQFAVTVKDSNGETVATNRITVKVVNGSTKLGATLKVNNLSSTVIVTAGTPLNISIDATGESGSYTYKYVLYNTKTGNWNLLSDYSSSNTYTCTLGSSATVEIAASVKDSSGTIVSVTRVKVIVS